jgi:Ca2+-binding RTX toxin-like protein
MATKYNVIKITTNKRDLSGTNNADEVTMGGEGNTFYAKKGNDYITVTGGESQKVYGEAGNDTVIVNKKARYAEVYGGAGKDKITIKSNFDSEVYGGADADTITIAGGSSHDVNGEAGNDKIYLKGGNYHKVEGGAGDDTITVSKGSYHWIYGNDQNDRNKGNNKITVNAGDHDSIFGGTKTDKIWINAGKEHFVLSGKGDDSIYLQKKTKNGADIRAGAGTDTIEATAGNKHTIQGGAGKDTITVSTSGNLIFGDEKDGNAKGNDTINITGGSKNTVYCNSNGGYDTVKITGGAGGNTVYSYGTGDQISVSAGKANIINIYCNDEGNKKTSGKLTMTGGTSSISIDYLDKTAAGSKFVINAAKGTAEGNTLTIDYAADYIKFGKDASGKALLLTYDYYGTTGGTVEIQNFANEAFSSGIIFGNQLMSYADVKKKAGF